MSNPFQQVIYDDELSEGRPSQRHPLEGHEYHKKTDAQLEYIAKDAHKAAEAMKSHNTDAENKYRDQANDSATVRYWRKKNGMPDWYKKKYGHMKEEVEITEAKGALTYKPEHAKWGVVPKSSKEFVKFFPKDKEADAKAHAEKTGGTLKKIDQVGRAMREDVELEEASDTKRPPNFTMHPIDRQDYKILKDPKKKPLPKDSKEWGRDGSEKKMKEEVEQGVAEAAKWRRDDLEGKTWRGSDWDDGELSPDKIQIDRSGKDVHDSGDELKSRPSAWRGKADMAKRMTKKGTPTKSELAFQNNLKMRMRMKKKEGGLTGPQGTLPEEVELEEAFSDAQIARLKTEYSKISGIDPASESYKKLIALLDKQDKATLQKLADSGIKFISGLARNRVIRMKEEVELEEAISIEHDRYMRSHGKKASGTGTWMFTHKRAGDVDYKNDKEVHQARGSFSDAAKSAKAWAKSHGHSSVYVMEDVELDEKTLTPAELKKREEVAKAMEREKPGMPMAKKMAIATAVAKRVAEQNEDSE